MQIQPRKKSPTNPSTLHTKKKLDLLSQKLTDASKKLDKTVARSINHTEALFSYLQQLDKMLLRLRVWESDINIQRPMVKGEPLPMREWTTPDSLNILDAGHGPAVAELHATLDQMITDTASISHTLDLFSREMDTVQ